MISFLTGSLGIIYFIAALVCLFIFTVSIITLLPIRLEKDKIIRLIYVATFSSVLFYLFLYPLSKEKSIIEKYIYNAIYCNLEIIYTYPSDPSDKLDAEIFSKFKELEVYHRKLNCPSKSPLISLETRITNTDGVVLTSTIFLFILSIIAVFLTRKYSVCLYYFTEKVIKKLFNKI
jgi:hypothetical protein